MGCCALFRGSTHTVIARGDRSLLPGNDQSCGTCPASDALETRGPFRAPRTDLLGTLLIQRQQGSSVKSLLSDEPMGS